MKKISNHPRTIQILAILLLLPFFIIAQQPAPKIFRDKNLKYGYKNTAGEIVIEAKYDRVSIFSSGMAIVGIGNKLGFIDQTGKEITPIKYDVTENFIEDRARIQLNNKWGFIDRSGKEIIPPAYQQEDVFKEGLTRVQLNDKWGFIDKTGKKIIDCVYEMTGNFKEGLAQFITDKKFGFIDKTGKQIVPNIYQFADTVCESIARVQLNNKWGFINKTGKPLTEIKYENTGNFKNGLALVLLDNKLGYINNNGKEITPIKYTLTYPFADAIVARVSVNKKFGLMDRTGKELTELKYDSIGTFTDGLAKAKLDNKWGYINTAGKEIVQVKYDFVGRFVVGLCRVKLNNKYGVVDKTGKEIMPVKYQYLEESLYGGSIAQVNDKWGWVDSTGKEIVPCVYEEFADFLFDEGEYGETGFSQGQAMAKLNGKWGVIDKKGKEIIPIKYDDIENTNETDEPNEYYARLNNERFRFDANGKILETKTIPATTAKIEPKTNADIKLLTPRMPMQGVFDPSLVGTWKNSIPSSNANGYFIFRANGTYDYWSDNTTTKAPEASNTSFWRMNGDELEVLPVGRNAIVRLKLFKKNDPQNNKAALVIEWNAGNADYRTYYSTETKELWKTNNNSSTTKKPATNESAIVKPAEPPVKLNGIVDQTMNGVWKFSIYGVDYFMDFKADGTYDRWTSTNTRKEKCYYRIDNGFFESVCTGKGRAPFQKTNDLVKGKPSFTLDMAVYLPVTDKEMWTGK